MLSSFSKALDSAIQQEYEIASQVSDEEWEAIRPSKGERRNFLLDNVKVSINLRYKRDRCTLHCIAEKLTRQRCLWQLHVLAAGNRRDLG